MLGNDGSCDCSKEFGSKIQRPSIKRSSLCDKKPYGNRQDMRLQADVN